MAEEIKEFKPETIPEFELKEEDIPWLTSDKLDASISIRGSVLPNFYTTSFTNSWTSDITVTTWFRPKYVYIYAIYDSNLEVEMSMSWIVENDDGTLSVMTTYQESNDQKTLWKWWTTINVVNLLTSPNLTARMKEFTSTGFVLDNVSFFWGCRLHILAMW